MQQPRRTAVTPLSARQVVSVWLAAAVCMSVRYTGVAATAVPQCLQAAFRSFLPFSLRIHGALTSILTQHQLNRWMPFEHLSRAAKHDESRRMLEAKRAIANGCRARR